MNALTVNAISDARSDPDAADAFDSLVQSLAKALRAIDSLARADGLQKVYVQFQFDCATLPNAVRGLRVARFSKKHGHVEAYAEVSLVEFRPLSTRQRCELLVRRLDEVLGAVIRALDGKVQHGVPELRREALTVGRKWCESDRSEP